MMTLPVPVTTPLRPPVARPTPGGHDGGFADALATRLAEHDRPRPDRSEGTTTIDDTPRSNGTADDPIESIADDVDDSAPPDDTDDASTIDAATTPVGIDVTRIVDVGPTRDGHGLAAGDATSGAAGPDADVTVAPDGPPSPSGTSTSDVPVAAATNTTTLAAASGAAPAAATVADDAPAPGGAAAPADDGDPALVPVAPRVGTAAPAPVPTPTRTAPAGATPAPTTADSLPTTTLAADPNGQARAAGDPTTPSARGSDAQQAPATSPTAVAPPTPATQQRTGPAPTTTITPTTAPTTTPTTASIPAPTATPTATSIPAPTTASITTPTAAPAATPSTAPADVAATGPQPASAVQPSNTMSPAAPATDPATGRAPQTTAATAVAAAPPTMTPGAPATTVAPRLAADTTASASDNGDDAVATTPSTAQALANPGVARGELTAPPRLASIIAPEAARLRGTIAHRTLEIRLDPPDLGTVDLEIRSSGSTVTIVARTESAEAMLAVLRQRDAIEASLRQLGMDLSGFDVSAGTPDRQQTETHRDRSTAGARVAADTADVESTTPVPVDPRGSVFL